MRFSRRLLFVSLLVLCSLQFVRAQDPCSEGTAYRDCKACGSATSPKGQTLNVQKNRDEKATSPDPITVAELARANSPDSFPDNKQVWVRGYVASVVPG